LRLNTKTLVSSAVVMTTLIVVMTVLSAWSFRRFSLYMAERHALSVAETVKIGLTEAMINGTINKRLEFLERLRTTPGIAALHVVRGPAVIQQFGPGFSMEQSRSDEEREVVAAARPRFSVVEQDDELVFRGTVPYVASTVGTPNCLQCHQVEAGKALGAITIDISLAEVRGQAITSVVLVSLVVALVTLASLLWLRRIIRPVTSTALAVREVAAAAATGNFTGRINHASSDEVGEIAAHLNHLLGFLEREVGTIQERIAELMGQHRALGNNLLAATAEMVDALVSAAKFKQAIEEDQHKSEIYSRLADVLRTRFEFRQFTIYEVSYSKNRMVAVAGDPPDQDQCRHCDQRVFTDAASCRAKRTGHVVDGILTPGICTMFRPGADDEIHVCLPIVLSGSAGCIVQVVIARDEGHLVEMMLPFLLVYLRETGPVLEAKRLMDSLRENALRDAMTGLYNRRFVEEYVGTLMSGVERKKGVFSILMLDFDYFKQVNDTHGHEAGDKVLKALAELLKHTVRGSDIVVRYGGEEFLVILLDTDADNAMPVAEKIRGEIAATKVNLPSTVLQKTISIGVAQYPIDADSFWQVVKFADVALYEAKRTGRNRVVRFEAAMWQEDAKY
jgi:diguanylate cyclase (GGDEF)-like protein